MCIHMHACRATCDYVVRFAGYCKLLRIDRFCRSPIFVCHNLPAMDVATATIAITTACRLHKHTRFHCAVGFVQIVAIAALLSLLLVLASYNFSNQSAGPIQSI